MSCRQVGRPKRKQPRLLAYVTEFVVSNTLAPCLRTDRALVRRVLDCTYIREVSAVAGDRLRISYLSLVRLLTQRLGSGGRAFLWRGGSGRRTFAGLVPLEERESRGSAPPGCRRLA